MFTGASLSSLDPVGLIYYPVAFPKFVAPNTEVVQKKLPKLMLERFKYYVILRLQYVLHDL